jgi:hypothetical protein
MSPTFNFELPRDVEPATDGFEVIAGEHSEAADLNLRLNSGDKFEVER